MAADVEVRRWTGPSGGPTKTQVDGGSSRLSTSDNPYIAAETTNPIPIPQSGTVWSFWGVFRPRAESAPATNLNNLDVFTDGASSLPTSATLFGQTGTAYTQAIGVVGSSGSLLGTPNYPSLSGTVENVFDWTDSSPKAIAGNTSGTGDFGDFLALQMGVPSTVAPTTGPTTSETFTIEYDES